MSFSNGYTTIAGMGGWKKYDAETSSWITSDFTANDLSLCLPDQEGNLMIPMTSSETPVSVYFSRTEVNTWNLYVLDASAPNNLKKIEGGAGGGGGGGGGDVEAETARAKAVEQALSGAIDENTSDITSISGNVDNLSNALTALSDGLSDYLPLSGGTLTGDTTVDSSLSVSGDLSVGEAQFNDGDTTGLTITKDDESYQFGGTESDNQVARKGDLSVYVLSSQLSDAMAGNLSSANAANPVMLSSDLSALVEKAIKFKGAVSTSAALPSADVDIGDMYIITGDGDDAGAEFVCTSLSGDPVEPVWSELGREGTTAALWDAVTTLSNTTIPTLCTDLSTAISANTTSITAISDVIENGISTAIEGITADIDTLSNTTIPTLCTDLSNAITDITSNIDGISTDIYGDGETSGLSGKVDDLTTNVGTISTDIYDETNGLSVQVSALKDDVDSLESSLTAVSSDLTAVSSDLTAVSADLTAVSSAVSALQETNVSVNIDNVSSDQLNVLHISEADYHQLVVDGDIDPKTIYIVSADGY